MVGRLARRRHTVEHEHLPQAVLGNQPRRPEEQAGEVRGDAALRVAQRRAVAKANQREELVELAVAVDRQYLLTEIAQRDWLILDDGGEDNAHGGS